MTPIGLTILVIFSYELIIYFKLKNSINYNLIIYKKLYSTFLNKKLSDEIKEKFIKKYSTKLFIISFKIIFVLVIILITFFIANLFLKNLIIFSLSIHGIILSLFTIIIYIKIRNFLCKITI
tara:strand:+ start:1678 stop:2043 length:366 start_codon:yes stop_codon:yes gene_type:complete